jgi:hypothetical protein
MKPRVGYFLFCLLFTAPFQLNASEGKSLAIAAEAIRTKSDGIGIRFFVKNISQNSIRIFQAFLPWIYSSSTICIIRTDSGALWESDRVSFGFPPAGEITIKAGEEISGEISIKKLFTKAPTLVKEKSFYLYWSYVSDAESDAPVGKKLYGGVVLVTQ